MEGRTGCRCRTAYNCGDTHLRRSSEIFSEIFSDWHLGSRRRRSRRTRRLPLSSRLPYHQINVIDTQTTGLSTILWTVAVHKLTGLRILSSGVDIRRTRFNHFWRKIHRADCGGGIICRSITAFRVRGRESEMSGINGAEGRNEGRGDSMEGWMEECATSDNNKGIKNAAAIAPLNSIDVRVQILEFRSSAPSRND